MLPFSKKDSKSSKQEDEEVEDLKQELKDIENDLEEPLDNDSKDNGEESMAAKDSVNDETGVSSYEKEGERLEGDVLEQVTDLVDQEEILAEDVGGGKEVDEYMDSGDIVRGEEADETDSEDENESIETGADGLLSFLRDKEKIPVSKAADKLGVPDKTIDSWARALESKGYVDINYSVIRGKVMSLKDDGIEQDPELKKGVDNHEKDDEASVLGGSGNENRSRSSGKSQNSDEELSGVERMVDHTKSREEDLGDIEAEDLKALLAENYRDNQEVEITEYKFKNPDSVSDIWRAVHGRKDDSEDSDKKAMKALSQLLKQKQSEKKDKDERNEKAPETGGQKQLTQEVRKLQERLDSVREVEEKSVIQGQSNSESIRDESENLKKIYEELENRKEKDEGQREKFEEEIKKIQDMIKEDRKRREEEIKKKIEEEYSELNSKIESLEQKLEENRNQDRTEKIQKEVERLEEKIGDKEQREQIKQLQDEIEHLEDKVDESEATEQLEEEIEDRYSKLENKLEEVRERQESQLSSVEERKSKLENKIGDLQSEMNKLKQEEVEETQSQLQDIEEKYENLETEIKQLQTGEQREDEELERKAERIEEEYDKLNEKIENINEKIDEKQDKSSEYVETNTRSDKEENKIEEAQKELETTSQEKNKRENAKRQKEKLEQLENQIRDLQNIEDIDKPGETNKTNFEDDNTDEMEKEMEKIAREVSSSREGGQEKEEDVESDKNEDKDEKTQKGSVDKEEITEEVKEDKESCEAPSSGDEVKDETIQSVPQAASDEEESRNDIFKEMSKLKDELNAINPDYSKKEEKDENIEKDDVSDEVDERLAVILANIESGIEKLKKDPDNLEEVYNDLEMHSSSLNLYLSINNLNSRERERASSVMKKIEEENVDLSKNKGSKSSFMDKIDRAVRMYSF